MSRSIAGVIGGVIGGIIKLLVDQTMLASQISRVDTLATVSQFFPGLGWLAYLVATGLVGWVAAVLMPKEYAANYFSSGLILGVGLWGAMNILFAVTGFATPTWSMDTGSFTVNLVSHLILGVTIVYALFWVRVKAAE